MYNGKFVDISLENDYTDDDYQEKVELAEINPFRYRSYYLDEETGLYYLNTRYYDPEIGRFINADSISILSEGKDLFNGLNLFVYCGSNPVNNIDETGEAWWDWLWKITLAIVGVVAIAALTAITAGAFAVALGASASVVSGVVSGALIGGLVSGGLSIINQASNGIDFLGFRTILNENGKIIRLLRAQAKQRLRRKIKHLYKFKAQKLVDDEYVNVRLNAYYAHLCHSDALKLMHKYLNRYKNDF